jgi:hypothetical protein
MKEAAIREKKAKQEAAWTMSVQSKWGAAKSSSYTSVIPATASTAAIWKGYNPLSSLSETVEGYACTNTCSAAQGRPEWTATWSGSLPRESLREAAVGYSFNCLVIAIIVIILSRVKSWMRYYQVKW